MKLRRQATVSQISKIYDHVHMVAWACLVAFVSWFCVFVLPKAPEIRVRAEMLHDNEVAVEEDLYCGKLGMGPRNALYRHCISYLGEYRAKIEQRIATETNLFF